MTSNRNNSKLLADISGDIAKWLAGNVSTEIGYPARSFYGETFGIWLLLKYPSEVTERAANLLLKAYQRKEKSGSEFHWEFNKYALVSLHIETGDRKFSELAFPLQFKNTPATNWVLLRCTTELMAGEPKGRILRVVRQLLSARQCSSGLICDEPGARSFQYHCFSAVLLGEIYGMCGDQEIGTRFRRAVNFIVKFILRNGDCLYIGRGQEQSFGYGSLIYLLASAVKHTGRCEYLSHLEQVLGYLTRFRRADGSFPLVVCANEKGFPACSADNDPRFPGWYSYNNYFDYLPFLGVMLSKAAAALSRCEPKYPENSQLTGYSDSIFKVVRRPEYDAVVAAPGGTWKGWGHWSNDLAIPYIVSGLDRLTPSYGGEQYSSRLYCQEAVALPVIRAENRYLSIRRGRIWSRFVRDTLVIVSLYGVVVRRFKFEPTSIVVADRFFGRVPLYAWYLFDAPLKVYSDYRIIASTGLEIIFSQQMEIRPELYYGWSGPLTAVRSIIPSGPISMRISIKTR